MNKKQKRRLTGIICLLAILSTAATLVLYALKQNINLFYTPTELLHAPLSATQSLRVGGYVKTKSVAYDNSGQSVSFIITDNKNMIAVNYHGVLPSLFREGQGVVVTGRLVDSHHLAADQVLAKHDEKYMPWPLKKELEKESKS